MWIDLGSAAVGGGTKAFIFVNVNTVHVSILLSIKVTSKCDCTSERNFNVIGSAEGRIFLIIQRYLSHIFKNLLLRSNPLLFPFSHLLMQVHYNPFRTSATPSSLQSQKRRITLSSHTKIRSRNKFLLHTKLTDIYLLCAF